MRLLTVFLGVVMLLENSSTASALNIIVEGRAATAIVLPQKPRPVEQLAAEELQHHIRKASGAELTIVREGESPGSYAGLIYVGHSRASQAAGIDPAALAGNGFTIRLVDGNLYLMGQDDDAEPLTEKARTGTLFAVYEFLERHLGVRWLWPGKLGEFVPPQRDIRVQSWDQTEAPRFQWTDWRNSAALLNKPLWPDADRADDFHRAQALWKKRLRFAGTNDIRPSHNFMDYWKRYGQSQPEIFNRLPDGQRRPLEGDDGKYITLCVAEQKLLDQIVRDWQGRGKPPVIKIGENDSPGMCTCEKCRAWDAPDWRFHTSPYWGFGQIPDRRDRFTGVNIGLAEGSATWGGWFSLNDAPSLSDRYARFYKTVFEKARQIDPNVIVAGFAYANYWRGPVKTKLNDQILISYVPPLWFPYTERMSQEMRENWDGWRATGATLMFRPNLTLAGHAMPIDYARPMVEDLRYIAHTGSVAMDFDSLTGSWATQGPTLYALGRSVQRPDMTTDQILEEYYAGFGPAADAVRRYFEHWQEVSQQLSEDDINRYYFESGRGGSFKNWILIADRIFTPEIIREGERRLAQARAAAAGDSQAVVRVTYLTSGFVHAQLSLKALEAHKAHQAEQTSRRRAALVEAVRRLYQYRTRIQGDMVANLGYLSSQEPAEWRTLAQTKK